MDEVVVDRSLVREREMPEVEVRDPDRQRDERVDEHAQRSHRREREQRPEERAGQPQQEQERRQVSEQQVLDHVEREALLAERGDRRDERDEQRQQAEREENDPPPGHGRAAAGERSRAQRVRAADGGDAGELERVEGPVAH